MNSTTPQKRKTSIIATHATLLGITILWSFNNIVMKLSFEHIGANMFTFLRLVFALPFLIYLAFFLPSHVRFEKRDLVGLTFVGIFGFGFFQLFFPVGIDQTSPAIGGILMATMPMHVVVISLIFRFESITKRIVTGIFLTLVGLACISFVSRVPGQQYETTLQGIIFVVVAELAFAVNTTFIKRYLHAYPLLQLTGYVMFISFLFFSLFNIEPIIHTDYSSIPVSAYLGAAYSGLIALLGSNILWNKAIGKIGSAKTSVYANIPPVFVLLWSMILLDDIPHPLALAGSFIIIIGVVIVQWGDFKDANRSRQP